MDRGGIGGLVDFKYGKNGCGPTFVFNPSHSNEWLLHYIALSAVLKILQSSIAKLVNTVRFCNQDWIYHGYILGILPRFDFPMTLDNNLYNFCLLIFIYLF